MTLPVEAAIADLLCDHLLEFAEAESPALAVAMPGRAFDPEDGEPYLDVTFLPNGTVPFAISNTGSNQHIGLLQVAVMWPSDNTGLIPALQLAGRIGRHFGRGTRLNGDVCVRITKEPAIAPALQEPSRFRVPVTVSYLCFAKPPTNAGSAVPAGALKWGAAVLKWGSSTLVWR